ncbi:MAG TPA: hypothetical protein VMZ28_00840 [Kofleriaceae bacterium]|nr:hypothetical protein [Kofleriaceae bacterium]
MVRPSIRAAALTFWLLGGSACVGELTRDEPDDPTAGSGDDAIPETIRLDPGFEAEISAIGWHPQEPAAGLDRVQGDGAAPPPALAAPPQDARSPWGGLAQSGLGTTATGFFHIERPPGAERVWLVDPDGDPFWAAGINTVLRTASTPDIEAYLRRLPDFAEVARIEWNRLSMVDADGLGFNSTPAFSETNDLAPGPSPLVARAPHGIRLRVSVDRGEPFVMKSAGGTILGDGDTIAILGDPFNPAYRALLAARWATQVRPADRFLMVYWLDNEIGLFDWPLHHQPGTVDMRRWIWSDCPAGSSLDAPACAPHALGRFLRDRYGDPGALSAAWGRSFDSFDAVLAARPTPGSQDATRRCDGACEQDLQRFQRVLWRAWVKLWTQLVRELDPNHLVGSPRMAIAHPGLYCFWGIDGCIARFIDGRRVHAGDDVAYSPFALFRRNGPYGFDVIGVNAYSRPDQKGYDQPWLTRGFHEMIHESGLPIWVSEFGVRARIDGWTNRGGAPSFVPDAEPARAQELRGEFYQHDMAQFARFRGVVGASFHRWADHYTAADQHNAGIAHRNGELWDLFTPAVRAWNRSLYARIAQLTGW